MNRLEQLYVDNAGRLEGIPEFHLVPEKYLVHLGKPFVDGTLYADFCAEIDREHQHLASQVDPKRPIYNNEERKGWSAFTAPEEQRDALTNLCASIDIPDDPGQDVLDVLLAMVDRLSRWYTLPRAGVEEKNADFAFYRLRCVLAAGGFTNWKVLSSLVLSQVGECPYNPDETREEWEKALVEAHRTCGWPSTLLWLDWASIPDFEGDCDWMKPIAFCHFLKHVRRASTHLHMVYRGTIEFSPLEAKRRSRAIGTPVFWQNYSRVLAKPSGDKSAKASALVWAAAILGPDDLLPAIPVSDLPGEVLAGPWSTLLPAYIPPVPGFFCPGTRLAGVWRADHGKVVPYEGDEQDCLGIAWNTATAASEDHGRLRALFAASLPKTYPRVSPSTLLKKAFPHLLLPEEGTTDHAGYCALIDAVFCASILRHGVGARPDLLREFPLVCILPATPSAEESTNQGKGLLCQSIAGAFAPGVPLTSAPDSSSAPDSRAVADELRNFGTLALDEFQIPASRSHILSRDNLQALCTAGSVASGRVFENAGKVALRHSLVVNAKWLDLSADLRNRSLPLFLGQLSEEQRARIDIKEMLESGQFALLLRLAAVSLVESTGIRELGRPSGKSNSTAWRFTTHRMVAAHILREANPALDLTSDAAYDVVDSVRADLDDDLARHQQMADETGLSASTSAGVNIRLSWAAFWSGLDDAGAALIAGQIATSGESRTGGARVVSISALCRMRLEAMGKTTMGFAALLPALTGQDVRVSNTAVTRSLSLSARSYYSGPLGRHEELWADLPGELGNKWEALVIPRAWNGESASARTLVVGLRMKGQQ